MPIQKYAQITSMQKDFVEEDVERFKEARFTSSDRQSYRIHGGPHTFLGKARSVCESSCRSSIKSAIPTYTELHHHDGEVVKDESTWCECKNCTQP